MKFEDLTPEQIEQAKACKTPAELSELAQSIGIELTDEQLDSMSGGVDWKKANCPWNDCDSYDSCTIRY